MTIETFLAAAANMEAHDRIVLLVAVGVTRIAWLETIMVEEHDYPLDYVNSLIGAMLSKGTLIRARVPFDLVFLRGFARP